MKCNPWFTEILQHNLNYLLSQIKRMINLWSCKQMNLKKQKETERRHLGHLLQQQDKVKQHIRHRRAVEESTLIDTKHQAHQPPLNRQSWEGHTMLTFPLQIMTKSGEKDLSCSLTSIRPISVSKSHGEENKTQLAKWTVKRRRMRMRRRRARLEGSHVVQSQIQLLAERFTLEFLSVHLICASSQRNDRREHTHTDRTTQ